MLPVPEGAPSWCLQATDTHHLHGHIRQNIQTHKQFLKEMHIQTTLGFHCTPMRVSATRKMNGRDAAEDAGKEDHRWKSKIWGSHYVLWMGLTQLKCDEPHDPATLLCKDTRSLSFDSTQLGFLTLLKVGSGSGSTTRFWWEAKQCRERMRALGNI